MSAKLPALIQPSHYIIHYTRFDFVNFTFQGSVSIDCTAIACTRLVTLHALDLQILNATAATKNAVKKLYKAVEFHFKRNDQTCDILFDTDLQWGEEYTLSVDFVGTLNDQMRGLYRSTYMGLDGKTHVMATTQFEPTDARRAFPCLDEPAAKATFCMVVTIPATLQCISNTPVASAISGDNGTTKTITFSKTPKMSTYLVALVVGQFDCVSETSNQIVTTVYAVPGKADQAGFCLDTAVRCLDLYQELFQVPYPLVKSDLVAIPDFAGTKR
jgi:aminopeptidase N